MIFIQNSHLLLTVVFIVISCYTHSFSQLRRSQCRRSVLTPKLRRNLYKLFAASIDGKINIANNSGETLKKEVLVSGTGKSIEAGDILAVEYTARVRGSNQPAFAKGDQEQFIYKDGSAIQGWDMAIGSMKIGEHSKFTVDSSIAYGAKGVPPIIPPNTDVELDIKILAWLGNQLRPESLFQKDLDIDPFVASTPESIQAEYEEMQVLKEDKYEGSIIDIYWRRIKNISFGFGGSNFFASQSGEKAPWYLNPNLTFPAMILFVILAFATVLTSGAVREKGASQTDLEVAKIEMHSSRPHGDTSYM